MQKAVTAAASSAATPPASLGEIFWLWLKIGCINFGGPAGQIALMHRIFVEEKKWLSEARFLHALNYCMLLPGPEAQQLATYIGWLTHRTAGGLIAGILFVLPGALVMLGLSVLYVAYAGLEPVQGLLFGLKAAVLAVVIEAVIKVGNRVLKNTEMVLLAAAAFIGIFVFAVPFPVIVLGGAILGFIGGWFAPERWSVIRQQSAAEDALDAAAKLPPPPLARTLTIAFWCAFAWAAPVVLTGLVFGWGSTFAELARFFSVMAIVTFGGAYAVLAYVAQEAVTTYGWLTAPEMLHGLGLAETTPGPLILVLQFVGFLAGHRFPEGLDPWAGAVLASLIVTWVMFAPSFLWIFLGAPYVERLRGNRLLSAALSAITATVVGVILNLAIWFGLHVLFRDLATVAAGPVQLLVPKLASIDPVAAILAAAAALALIRFKVGMLKVLAASAAAGLAWTLYA